MKITTVALATTMAITRAACSPQKAGQAKALNASPRGATPLLPAVSPVIKPVIGLVAAHRETTPLVKSPRARATLPLGTQVLSDASLILRRRRANARSPWTISGHYLRTFTLTARSSRAFSLSEAASSFGAVVSKHRCRPDGWRGAF